MSKHTSPKGVIKEEIEDAENCASVQGEVGSEDV